MQISPQESAAVLVFTFELDVKKHFLDVCHDTDPMASESDKNMSEIWLKPWTFKETGLSIMCFGVTVEHDSTLLGSSKLYLLGMRHGEGGILSCLLYDLLHLSDEHGRLNVLAHCFTIHSRLLRILRQSSFSG